MSEKRAVADGHLFVVSAPSGAGKTSLIHALRQRVPNLHVSISHTTRPRRPAEQDGVDYHFVDVERFQRMIDGGEFLEHALVFDNYYGTSRAAVEYHLNAGHDVVLEIDWQGARNIRAALDETVAIFILPPSIEELERRLTTRGGDSAAVIARRMRDAVAEMSHFAEYDYLVINDDFAATADTLSAIVHAARHRQSVQRRRHAAMLERLVTP